MKTPTIVLSILAVITTAHAGVGSFLTQKKADWEFIQKTGGIELVESRQEKDMTYLKIKYDVSGLTSVTRKPETMNSGLAVKNMEVELEGKNVFLFVSTSVPDKSTSNEIVNEVKLENLEEETYSLFYGDEANPEKKIGEFTVTKN